MVNGRFTARPHAERRNRKSATRVERPFLGLAGVKRSSSKGSLLIPFVSITRLRVRSWRYLPGFVIQSFRAAHQAKLAAGSLAVSVLRDADRAFWTRTIWSDEAAMRSFMRSGVHRRVMAGLAEWCDEAALVHWVQEDSEPPSWPEAYRRLQREGRRSRVNHPTEAQRRFEIREPRTNAGLTFK